MSHGKYGPFEAGHRKLKDCYSSISRSGEKARQKHGIRRHFPCCGAKAPLCLSRHAY